MRRKNDRLWKGILEEVIEDLLQFFFPQVMELFDIKRGFEFLDKELSEMYPELDSASGTRYVDKLVKVYRKDGNWMLLHIEAQGYKDMLFSKRMFTYFYRIVDRYDRPVVSLAIFTGQNGNNMPDRYELHEHGSELKYKYNTHSIKDYDDDELARSDNSFALVLMAARTALLKSKNLDEKLLHQKLWIVRLLYQKGLSKRKTGAIVVFLHRYVKFSKSETNRIFMKELDQISGQKNTMGIFEQIAEEAREETRLEAQVNFVKSLLSNTEFSADKIASLVGVSVAFVKKVKRRKE